MELRKIILFVCLSFSTIGLLRAEKIKGIVLDKTLNEPLIGATVQVEGTAKGAIYGTLTGGLIMAFGWFKAIPQGFKKGNSIIKVFKHPFQVIGSKTKITAGITAVGIAAYNIVKGFLQANQRRAFIDQKLRNN